MLETDKKIDNVWQTEFAGKPAILKTVLGCIIKSRQGVEPSTTPQLFKITVEENIDAVLTLNVRWLISVCDTYADCGTELERSNATIISLMFNQIKLFDTYLSLVVDHRVDGNKIPNYKTKPQWGGMWGFNINKGDMVENLVRRLNTNLKTTPVLHQIWLEIMNKVSDSNNSFAVLKKIHDRGLYQL